MAVATPARQTVGSETRHRDRRAAEGPMGIWPIAPGLWKVGSGAGADYSEYLVDLREPACTCDDFRYRGGTSISRCKHASRVLQATGRLEIPADVDRVDPSLPLERERWSR
ncbi:MAG: hypothetical protein ACOC06_06240 [Halorubrum sp.]